MLMQSCSSRFRHWTSLSLFWGLLLILIVGAHAVLAQGPPPNIPQGGSASFSPTNGTGFPGATWTWEIVTPGGGQTITNAAPNGWTVSYSSQFTVGVPLGAAISTGYSVYYNTGGGGPVGGFNVVAAAGPPAVPGAPTGLTATAGNQSVSLAWTATPGAASYSVYRGTSAGGESTTALLTGLTNPSATDSAAANGTTYYYMVRAINSSGTSPASNEVSATPNLTAPTNLTAKPGNGQLSLAWTAVGGTGITYQVYQGTAAGGESATPIASGLTATAYTATGLTNGTTYYLVVKAVNNSVTGPASNEVNAAPVAPANLTAGGPAVSFPAVGADTTTSLQGGYGWEVANPSGTVVASSNAANGWTESASGSAPVTFTLQAPAAAALGSGYELRQSVPSAGYPASAFFNVIAAPIPAAPTGLAATSSNQAIGLTWAATSGAASYSVYRGTSAGGESTTALIAGLTTPSYSDAGLTNGTTYYYIVKAVSSGGTSSASNQVSATPNLTAPTNLTAKGSNGQVALAWTAISGSGLTYQVYQGTSASGEGATPTASGITGTSYTATGLTNGTVYFFVVKAASGGSTGPASNEATATPLPNPQVIAGGPSVSFPATGTHTTTSISGGYGWEIANPAGTVVASSGQTGANGWTESASGSPVTFTLQAPATASIGAGYEVRHSVPTSGYPASAYFDVVAPGPPAGLSASGGNQYVRLTWGAVAGASSYSVYRGTSAGGEGGTAIATGITASSYTDTGLTNGTTYYYIVKTVSGGGTSAASNEVHCTPTLVAPAPPTGLTATAGNSKVALAWGVGNGATGYSVFRGTVSGNESTTAIASPTGTSYTDASVTNGTVYYYTVKATNGAGSSVSSNEVSAAPIAPPATPTGLSAAAGNAQVALTWAASASATSYNLKCSTASGGPFTTVASPTATSATDTGLTNGTTYYYVVTAINGSGESPASSPVSATPTSTLAAPLLSAQAASSTQVNLTWGSVTGATSYNLYRSTTAGGEGSTAYKVGVAPPGPGAPYSDTGLTSGTTYYYQLTAVGPGGEGSRSGEASATPGSPALTAPLLKGVAGNSQVSLTWGAVTGATSYNVYRSLPQGSPYPALYKSGLTIISFTDVGLTNSTVYAYYVCAVNTAGQGSSSNQVSLTPGSSTLVAPLLSAQAASSTQVNLTWGSVTGATSYNLYRSTTAGGEGNAPYLVNPAAYSSGGAYRYSDTGLTTNQTYYYKVVAVGPGGEGTLSNEASATPGASQLSASANITATASSNSVAISVSWSAVSGATSYNLYRTAGYGGTLYAAGLTSTSFTDTNLIPEPMGGYGYYVTAVNKDGEGTASNTATAVVNGFYIVCPPSITIARGGTAAVDLTLTPLGTFAGSVLLSGTSLPASTQGLFYPAAPFVSSTVDVGYSITGNLYFNVGSNTSPGSYPITITGTANGFTYSTSLILMVP